MTKFAVTTDIRKASIDTNKRHWSAVATAAVKYYTRSGTSFKAGRDVNSRPVTVSSS